MVIVLRDSILKKYCKMAKIVLLLLLLLLLFNAFNGLTLESELTEVVLLSIFGR